MSQILSHRHVSCIIDGYRMNGWSDDDQPVEFPNEDLNEIKTGKDGAVYGTDTAMLGGPMIFRFAPTSPAVQWWIQRREEKQRGVRRIFSGSYADSEIGKSNVMSGGIIVKIPPMSVPGQTYEVTLHWEIISSDVDGANFAVYS